MASDDANVASTLPFLVESLPDEITQRFEPLALELQALGFCDPVYHVIHENVSGIRIYWATYRHESGQHMARIHNRYWDTAAKTERAFFSLFLTAFSGETFLVSSNGRPDTAEPPEVEMNRMPRAKTSSLWNTHLRKEEAAGRTKAIEPVRTRQELIDIVERLHCAQRDFHLRRGFFRERTLAENEKALALTSRVKELQIEGARYPEVLVIITNLENQKTRWTQGLLLLLISLGAFLGTGVTQWKAEITLCLVPILFFHELGHWVAMKIFGYRNMKMFFIPMFGAAVSGVNRTVAGWKKAIVSLAGPVPGILLGTWLAAVATLTHITALRMPALLLIALNVLNLVPMLPFDGGRFLYVTLFSRSRWLDFAFRLVAIGGLIAAAAYGFGAWTIYIAIVFAIGLPAGLKWGRIIDRFKHEPLPPPAPNEEHIPIATADVLIDASKEAFPKLNNAMLARQVLNIYEALNARPPGIITSSVLLSCYFGAIFISVLAFYTLIGRSTGLAHLERIIHTTPSHSVTPGLIEVWRGSAAQPSHYLVGATFTRSDTAQSTYNQTTAALESNDVAILFGDSVIAGLPSEGRGQAAEVSGFLSAKSRESFISSNGAIHLTLKFIAPNVPAATNLQEELQGYFRFSDENLIAPWNPVMRTQAFRAKREARAVWNRIYREIVQTTAQSFSAEISKLASESNTLSGVEFTNRLNAFRIRSLPLQDKERDALASEYAGTPYAELVEWNRQLRHIDLTNHMARAEILDKVADRLGLAKSSANAAYGAKVIRTGASVQVQDMTVTEVETNLPQLIEWLATRNCTDIRYHLDAGM